MPGLPFWLAEYYQVGLFADVKKTVPLTNSNTRIIVGQFFELLTKNLFGGEYCSNGLPGDIVQWRGKRGDILLEVKSSSKSHIIDMCQIEEYSDLRFPFTNPTVYYVLWFYDLVRIREKCLNSDMLIDRLATSVNAVYVLPLRVVRWFTLSSSYDYHTQWASGKRQKYGRWGVKTYNTLREGRRSSLADAMTLFSKDRQVPPVSTDGLVLRRNVIGSASVMEVPVQRFPLVRVLESKSHLPIQKGEKNAREDQEIDG